MVPVRSLVSYEPVAGGGEGGAQDGADVTAQMKTNDQENFLIKIIKINYLSHKLEKFQPRFKL